MACTRPVVLTLADFRSVDSLSGELCVVGGSRTRKGARRRGRRASCKSLEAKAGSDAACGATVGESANTSAAHAASRNTDADPAKPNAGNSERTPSKKHRKSPGNSKNKSGGDGPVEPLWQERAQLDGGDDLPDSGVEFVDTVNMHIDLVRCTELLLRGRDERSSKSLLEQLLKIRYGKDAQLDRAGDEGDGEKLSRFMPR